MDLVQKFLTPIIDFEEMDRVKKSKYWVGSTNDNLLRFKTTLKEQGLGAAVREDYNLTRKVYRDVSFSRLGYLAPGFLHGAFFETYPLFHNMCDTAIVYGFARLLNHVRPKVAAVAAVSAGVGSELLQKAEVISGTYDPQDIVAFIGGTVLAYGVDALVNERNKVSPNI